MPRQGVTAALTDLSVPPDRLRAVEELSVCADPPCSVGRAAGRNYETALSSRGDPQSATLLTQPVAFELRGLAGLGDREDLLTLGTRVALTPA